MFVTSISTAVCSAIELENEDQYSVVIIYYSLSKNPPKHIP